jgi:hypothetical protein
MWHPWHPAVRALCHGLERVGGHGPHIEGALAESLSAGGHAEGLAGPVQRALGDASRRRLPLDIPGRQGSIGQDLLEDPHRLGQGGRLVSSTLGRTRSFAVRVLLPSQTTRATPYRSSSTIR